MPVIEPQLRIFFCVIAVLCALWTNYGYLGCDYELVHNDYELVHNDYELVHNDYELVHI